MTGGASPPAEDAVLTSDPHAVSAAEVEAVEETLRVRAKSCEPFSPFMKAPSRPRSKSVPPAASVQQPPRPSLQSGIPKGTTVGAGGKHVRARKLVLGVAPRAGRHLRPSSSALGKSLGGAVPCSEHTLGLERGKRRPGGDPLQVRAPPFVYCSVAVHSSE